jgi:endonuclease/exonuclease/phosphatase family metal-dependent hydrolase
LGRFAQEPPEFAGEIRVVTFNIKMAEKITEALEELGEDPELEDADIILLQEMDPQGVEQISRAIGCNYVDYPSTLHPTHNPGMGNAVFATIQIEDRKVLAVGVSEASTASDHMPVWALLKFR